MGGGVGGEGVEPPRKSNVESSNPVLFLFFFLWEKRFDESLNFSDLFFLLIYSFSLSLSLSTSNHFASPQNFASFGREEEEEEEKRWCVFVFVSRERDGAK